jgi:beta-aspartyl-peptidase (threonine type)
MLHYGIITHGGVGSPPEYSDGCKAAAEGGMRILETGGSALDAVIEAARVLEDDPRYNAGTGSVLRLDGKTIEMDASLMDSEGRMGAVIAIKNVKNPILIARAVMDTPHIALAGDGAEKFARKLGFAPFDPVIPKALERHKKLISLLKERKWDELNPLWREKDLEALWNFSTPYKEVFSSDTIGAVALDKNGLLAVANSTGGASPMMLGRVGDSPLPGCGFYAGPHCAVAATGIGEEIIRRMLARKIHERAGAEEEIKSACDNEISLFPREVPAGVIAISRSAFSVSANREMAHSYLISTE